MSDDLEVLLVAAGAAAAVAGVGWLSVRRLRRGRLGVVVVSGVAPAVAIACVVAGLLAGARVMFVSAHDLRVLLLITAPAALAAFGVAVAVGRRLARDVRGVAGLARRPEASPDHLPRELADLVVELRGARDELEGEHRWERALESSRRELVAWVSHDLRTPLAGLRAMTEALEDGVVDDAPTVARYHRRMRGEVERLAAMVDDLLELSLLQAERRPLTLARVALSDVVADALAAAEPLARAEGVTLSGRAVDADTPVLADAAGLGRVLANLIVNALRHTPRGGAVEVVTGDGDGGAWVEVSDGCGGIPAEDLPRLFEVAFRGQAARSPEPDTVAPAGAGLGLAIARGLVEAHGGSLGVVNAGPGCRFTVRLPLAAPPDAALSAGAADAVGALIPR